MNKQGSKAPLQSYKKFLDTSLEDPNTELRLEIFGDVESGNEPHSESWTNEKFQNWSSGVTGAHSKLICCTNCHKTCNDPLVLLKNDRKKHSNRTFGDLISRR